MLKINNEKVDVDKMNKDQMSEIILRGRSVASWTREYPLLENIMDTEEVFWINPKYLNFEQAKNKLTLTQFDVEDAALRMERFAPYLVKAFPETKPNQGIIESPLREIPKMKVELESYFPLQLKGNLLLKCDNELPISGSIKARGGIYEVLKHAEDLAMKHHLLQQTDNYEIIDREEFRTLFSQYSIAVGSTGNLGLSIGIMSARLGFKVYVHMSADAKQWKKDLLRSKGVTVIEYDADFSKAVEEGRKHSQTIPGMYFIDDENSRHLFLGYAVAAYRLKEQLASIGREVNEHNPLFVYLPCGVGGGPGGITFGLKLLFKDNVHCFFVEPTHSPAMLIGLMTGLHDHVSVQDFGIDNNTEADGLAVGRPSGFIGRTLENLISGVYTIEDHRLFTLLKKLADCEGIKLEPSALAGLAGPAILQSSSAGRKYIKKHQLEKAMKNAINIPWATGGGMVPEDVMNEYYSKG